MTRRRVITGVDAEGRSVVVSNGPSSGRFGDSGWEELWAFDGVPARLHDDVDPVDVPMFRLAPAKDRIAVRSPPFGLPVTRNASKRTAPQTKKSGPGGWISPRLSLGSPPRQYGCTERQRLT